MQFYKLRIIKRTRKNGPRNARFGDMLSILISVTGESRTIYVTCAGAVHESARVTRTHLSVLSLGGVGGGVRLKSEEAPPPGAASGGGRQRRQMRQEALAVVGLCLRQVRRRRRRSSLRP